MEYKNDFKVYCHTCPNNKKYIGITHQKPERRWSNGYGYVENKHFYKAIQKYGWDNIKHEVLFDNLTQEDAESKEIELIAYYNTTNARYGYNKHLGGKYVPMTDEHRKKIAEANKGKFMIDETGNKYNMLTAIRFIKRENYNTYWEFVCDCGNKCIACISSVKSGSTKSCGCLFKEVSRNSINRTLKNRFPNAGKPYRKELRKIRDQMIDRYKNKSGVPVCDEWLKKYIGLDNFYDWAISNGYKKGLHIRRRDINGIFEPNNCLWGTRKDLANNRQSNRLFTVNGITKNMFQWAESYNMSPQTLSTRLKKGLSIEEALNMPIKHNKRRKNEKNICKNICE